MTAAAITSLAQRLERSNPEDSHDQREIFERIREMRSAFDGPLDPQSQRCLEAASMLVAYLARMGALAGEDVLTIAVRLLRSAADAEAAASAPPPQPQPTYPTLPPEPTMLEKARAPAPEPSPRESTPAEPHAAGTAAEGEAEKPSATDLMGDMMLGQILLQRGHILEEHIHQAMKVQRTAPLRIGDILVKIGACSRVQIEEALRHQSSFRRIRGSLAESDPPASTQRVLKLDSPEMRGTGLKLVGEIMLGEILIERNVITRRQLERALEVQKATGARIGEALVKMGATTHEHIEHALRLQGANRKFTGKPGKN